MLGACQAARSRSLHDPLRVRRQVPHACATGTGAHRLVGASVPELAAIQSQLSFQSQPSGPRIRESDDFPPRTSSAGAATMERTASPAAVTGGPLMNSPRRTLVALAAARALRASLLHVGLLPPFDSPSGVARAAILQPYATQGQLPVAPGVTHDWGTFATGSGQQVVNFVEVQPGAPGISFDAALSKDQVPGLERPSSAANRKSVEGHRAIVAINGDVWSGSSLGANAEIGR